MCAAQRPWRQCKTVVYRIRRLEWVATLFFLLIGAPAMAQEADDTTKNAARELAQRGSEAYAAGDYQTAQDLFHRAYALIQAPTLSLREARALVELRRWVEAVEAYVRTVRTKLEPKAPKAFQEAIDTARTELDRLRPRLPQLEIVVEGTAPGVDFTLTMDGKPVQRVLVGVATPVNPGKHELHASTENGAEAHANVVLEEGQKERVVLRLQGGGAAPIKSPPPVEVLPPPELTRSSGGTQRTLGWVAVGLGGAGAATGVLTGLLATRRYESAEKACTAGQCIAGSKGEQDLNEFRQFRTISTIGYIAGAVCAGAGLTLLLTAPSSAARESAAIEGHVSLGSVGITGQF